jgi:hypothetical protein
MNAMTMSNTALWLLGITALGGLLMAAIRFSGIPRPPSWLAMGHGLLAATALALLIYAAVVTGSSSTMLIGLALLVAAAGGGLFMNRRYHARMLPLPKGLLVGHGVLAVIGTAVLFFSAAA